MPILHIGAHYCANCHGEKEQHMPDDGKCFFGPAKFRSMTTDEYARAFPEEIFPEEYRDYYDAWIWEDPQEPWSLRNYANEG